MKLLVLLSAVTFITSCAFTQDYKPLELAEKIFSNEGMPNIKKYATGEYKGNPSGKDISPGIYKKFILLQQTENYAVVAMTLKDSSGRGFDSYLHFEKDKSWKMSAFRSLAMTGMIEAAKNELEAMSREDVDKEIQKARNNDRAMFSSRAEYEFELGNAKLTLDFDDNIVAHFKKNKKEFERVRDSVLRRFREGSNEEYISSSITESLKPDYQKLFISTIRGNAEMVDFVIGGMIDNTVGYLYVPKNENLPEMNESTYIMIREIGDGWYLYKTT